LHCFHHGDWHHDCQADGRFSRILPSTITTTETCSERGNNATGQQQQQQQPNGKKKAMFRGYPAAGDSFHHAAAALCSRKQRGESVTWDEGWDQAFPEIIRNIDTEKRDYLEQINFCP
jgi:hypothetical protein